MNRKYNPLFDDYELVPPVSCSTCGLPVVRGQGQDGPCLLLVWRQGSPEPVRQLVDEPSDGWRDERLPSRFEFVAWCPSDHRQLMVGETEDGVWVRTLERQD